MKRTLLVLFLFATFSLNAQVSLTRGLVAWYKFDGNTADSSGNANHVTVNNNATLTTDRFGNANSAYSFNGVNSYMKVPNSSSLSISGDSITTSFWIKVNGFNYTSCHGSRVLYKSDVNAGAGNYGLEFSDQAYTNGQSCSTTIPDTLHQTFYGLGTAGHYSSPYIQKGAWCFVVNSFDGRMARLYINNQLVDSSLATIASFSNSYDLYFGKLNSGSGLYFTNAALDDIRIYNRALSTSEMSALYTPAPITLNTGLVAWYKFNGNTADSSGNANHVTVNNNATLTTDRFGNANSAYSFNGTNSYMKVPTSTSLNITTGSISMCTWVKVNGFDYASCHGNRIMYKSDIEAGNGSWGIDFADNLYTNGQNCSTVIPDTLHETFYSNGAGSGNPPYVQKGVWYFVVITYDGPSTTAKLYVNGTLANTNVIAGTGFSNPYDLYFGKLNTGGGVYFLNGALDDIRIYNRAINASEVSALYTPANASPFYNGLVAWYKFDGNTADSSGYSNHVTANNNATLTTDRFGNANSAYAFNGTNSYMQVPNSPSLNLGTQITVCTWMKANGYNYGQCHGNFMIYKGGTTEATTNYGLQFGDAFYNPQHCTAGNIPDTLQETFYGSGTNWNNPYFVHKNVWYFVAATYDGAVARLYINGMLAKADTVVYPIYSNPYDLLIGRINNSSTPYWYNGILDDIRIYNRALDSGEIRTLYNPIQPADHSLVAWYKFDGNTADSSGYGNHVSINNNATLTTDRFGHANSAYSFNGVNSYMQVPNSPSLNIANTLTISTWIKVNGFNYASCHGNDILYKSDVNAGPGNYGIQFSDLNCATSTPDTTHEIFYGDGTLANYTSYIQKNTWYLVVSTYDGRMARTYINNQLVDSNITTISSFANIYDLYIGKLNSGSGLYFLNAALDDIRIYSRALNQSEIAALYTTTLPVDLVAFTAAKDKSNVDVSWQVASEINHAYYEVERSFDATNYSSITKVAGIYNNSGGSYTYTDANILSLATSPQIYYRLKMVSKTGDVTYSNVLHVSTGSTIAAVSAYPNPFQDHLVLNMTFQKSGPVGITITDMSGKAVSTQTIQVPQGNTTININNLANLAKGLYMLRITNADTVITKKILKGE